MGFLLVIGVSLNASNDKLYEIVSEYRENGLESIKSTLEKSLLDREYWESVVAKKDTKFGYYESVKYIFIASKKNASLQLFEVDSNKLSQLSKANAIFGENQGDKKIQGDLATPIGVYDLNKRLSGLDQYYGPLAFSTSYPNLYDRLNNKTGYGIWIHGLPLNGDRSEKSTRGCIVVENNILEQYDKTINFKDSILITSIDNLAEVPKSAIVDILQSLFIWRDAWINNDLDLYLSFYDDSFTRFDRMKIDAFKDYKRRIFGKEERKTIEFSEINIAPYPNMENQNMFRITFFEDYKADGGYKFKGIKELYVLLKNNKMSIIVER
ncbi:peptidase [Helicobacter sp. 16-1353]|nr:peptidase [Helicobacter sp. 16-1353]